MCLKIKIKGRCTSKASRLNPVPLTVPSSHGRSRLAGECILSVDVFIPDPLRSPASRLLQKKCVLSGTTTDRTHARRGHAAPDALRPADDAHLGRGSDAERHGIHSHAQRGNDQADPTDTPRAVSGTGFSREAFDLLLNFICKKSRHHQSRLGCRPNVDDAEWAEPHGCGESAVRTWMSVRRGPTERRRSEGIPTKEEPNQEQAPLVTWGAFTSNSPKAKCLPLGRRSLIFAGPGTD